MAPLNNKKEIVAYPIIPNYEQRIGVQPSFYLPHTHVGNRARVEQNY
jgi:hypothetical protein